MGVLASYAVWAYSWNFTIFVIARIIGGLSKGNVTISTAVIADVTSTKNRGKGMVTKKLSHKKIALEYMAIHQHLNYHTFVLVYIQEPSYIIFYSKHVQMNEITVCETITVN